MTLQLKMYNFEILNALETNKYINKHSYGVYPLDLIPSKVKSKPIFFIVNTHKAKYKGEHWVAIYIPIKGYAIYFDSYGFPPRHAEIKTFLKNNCFKYKYNKRQVQSIVSTLCGEFCCMFLLYQCRKKNLKSFYTRFGNKNLMVNDKKIKLSFRSAFKLKNVFEYYERCSMYQNCAQKPN